MADNIDAQLAALEAKAPLTNTPEEIAAGVVENEQREFENEAAAAIASEKPDTAAEPKPAADAKAPDPKAAPAKDDLPLEEIKKRWEDQKGLAAKERQERRAERAAREAAEQRAAAAEQRIAAIEARIRAGNQQLPDPDQDIVGYAKALEQRLNARDQADAQMRQQQQAANQQTQFVQGLQAKLGDFEEEFKADHPDYDEATDFLLDLEQDRLESIGIPKAQATQAVQNWAINTAQIMLRSGRNPAEIAYAQAQKLGWKPKGAAPAVPAVDPAAQANAAAAEKLAAVRNGAKASNPMQGGGSGGAEGSSLKALSQLKGAAFDAASEKFLRAMTR
jgi:hypothetical protein